MKLINKSQNPLLHSYLNEKKRLVSFVLGVNEVKDVEDSIAMQWLKINGVSEYVSPEEAKAKDEEIAKLKAELAKAKTVKPAKAKTTKKAKK